MNSEQMDVHLMFCDAFSMLKKPPQTGQTIFNVPFSSITSISEIIMRYISNPQLPKLNKVLPVSFSTLCEQMDVHLMFCDAFSV
jgi:hypothetical protein